MREEKILKLVRETNLGKELGTYLLWAANGT